MQHLSAIVRLKSTMYCERVSVKRRRGLRIGLSHALFIRTVAVPYIFFALLYLFVRTPLPTHAECPNACSGHGFCDFFDMCSCFRGWTSGDCSERTCPWGYAFVPTPQGDLNMDGDRDDNTWRRLSQIVRSYELGSSTIVLEGTIGTHPRPEVREGDQIRIRDEIFSVQWSCSYTLSSDCVSSAHNNTSSGDDDSESLCRSCTRAVDYPGRVVGERWTEIIVEHLDEGLLYGYTGEAREGPFATPLAELVAPLQDQILSKLDESTNVPRSNSLAGFPVFKHLRSQQRPYGTWERWPGDFSGHGQLKQVNDEGHFMMECSNRGQCDRKTGICECHYGYSGIACHMQTCPGTPMPVETKNSYVGGQPCNKHGRCLTVSKLAREQPKRVTESRFSTTAGSRIVYTEADVTEIIKPGSRMFFGGGGGEDAYLPGAHGSREAGLGYSSGGPGPGYSSGYGSQSSLGSLSPPPRRTVNGAGMLRGQPFVVESVEPHRLVLKKSFPRTFPYGTPAWIWRRYDLWDADKNRACACDSRYKGFDCSMKKCPRGDDPVTELGFDPLFEDFTNPVNPNRALKLDQSASFYEQQPERQSLYISTLGGEPARGTFRLTITDQYGDRWTTKPIPTRVRLSVVPKTDPVNDKSKAGGVVVDFYYPGEKSSSGNKLGFGLSVDEVSVGDIVQCGDEFRRVEVIVYSEGRYRGRIRHIKFSGALWDTTAQRPWYRVTVAKEIREAILALPMERFQDITVIPRLRRSGRRLSQLADTETENSRLTFLDFLENPSDYGESILLGDYVRVGSEIRKLRGVISKDKSFRIHPFFLKSSLVSAYKFTGVTYEISFSPGCRSHTDCRWNGINKYDSDSGINHLFSAAQSQQGVPSSSSGVHSGANRGEGGSWFTEGNGEDDGATCHAGGFCVCSDPTIFTGRGCTRQGIAGHAAEIGDHAVKKLPGDIPLLDCDANNLWSGQTLPWTAQVSRDRPKVVTLTYTDGEPDSKWDSLSLSRFDRIEIAGQRRTILWIQTEEDFANKNSVTLRVDYDFIDDGKASLSDGTSYEYIFDPMTPVVKLSFPNFDDGTSRLGEEAQCLVTDIRAVSDESSACHYSERPNCGRASIGGTGTKLNRIVTFKGPLSDQNEIMIGDRIRLVTSGEVIPGGEGEGQSPRWETRTVDHVIYENGVAPNIGVPAKLNDNFGEKRIVAVTVSFGFTAPWQQKPVSSFLNSYRPLTGSTKYSSFEQTTAVPVPSSVACKLNSLQRC